MPKALKNILIIKPSSLGDIVLALPTLSALHNTFPDAKISWLVRPEFAPLLENHPFLTALIIFDRRFLGRAYYNPKAFAALLSLIRRLRRNKFDAIFDFQGLFRTASLTWLTGCKKRFGMTAARELAHLFYTHKIPQDSDTIHLVDYYLKIVKATGVTDTGVEFVLPQPPKAADAVRELLNNNKVTPDNYAVFIPSSTHSDKCWPLERFAALADKISSQFGLSIVATGTTSERDIVESTKSLASIPIVNLAGRTNLVELIALLKAAKLVVSNDTGPGHIAAALGVPLVMIFGRANPVRIAPYRRAHCVVAVDQNGRGLKPNSTDPRYDVKAITLDQVYQKVCEQLEQPNP